MSSVSVPPQGGVPQDVRTEPERAGNDRGGLEGLRIRPENEEERVGAMVRLSNGVFYVDGPSVAPLEALGYVTFTEVPISELPKKRKKKEKPVVRVTFPVTLRRKIELPKKS